MQSSRAGQAVPDLPCDLIHLMNRTHMAIWQFINHSASRMGGITGMQASVLLMLNSRRGISAADLAREYGINPSAITRLVDHLVHHGMVRRVPCDRDRRVLYLRLTSQGRTVASQLPAVFSHVYQVLLEGMDEEDVDTLRGCLKLMLLNVRLAEEAGEFCGSS